MDKEEKNTIELTEDGIIKVTFVGDQSEDDWFLMDGRLLSIIDELRAKGKTVLLLIDDSELGDMSPGFLKGAFGIADYHFDKVAAVILKKSVINAVNFFTSATRYKKKSKLFKDVEEAKKWLLG